MRRRSRAERLHPDCGVVMVGQPLNLPARNREHMHERCVHRLAGGLRHGPQPPPYDYCVSVGEEVFRGPR